MTRTFLSFILALFTGAVLAAPAAPLGVPGEFAVSTKEAPAPRLRLAAKVAGPALRLPAVAESELERVRGANRNSGGKRLMIGVNRPVALAAEVPSAANVAWVAVEGGHAARFSAGSTDAASLRLAIELRGTPLDVEMVFFGSDDPQRLVGPVRVGEIADRTTAWWSPPTDGDTQTVEVFVPAGHDPKATGFRLAQVSHIFTSAGSSFKKRAADIGDSGSCNVDIQCISNPSQAFLNTRLSVAKMIYAIGTSMFLCTGTLLNDTDAGTQIPWFYTANHCFENNDAPFRTPAQMQVIANTLTTYWFFEAISCGSQAVPNFVTRSGGATYVYNNQPGDVLFLRLNESAPAGSFFSGWSPTPFAAGQTGTGIHHPQGDLKKVSQGTVQGFSTPFFGATSNGYTEIRWTLGTTEGGSSGSGLWAFDGSQYFFRGGLWGGGASCTSPNLTDNYSRFDLAYPVLRQFLETSSTPFADFTDLWWNPNESGWGLNLIQHPTNQIFGVWYTYDANGKRTWFVMSGGSWTSSSTFTGDLYQTSGPPYNVPFNPNSVHVNRVGTGTLAFSSADAGTWTYSVNGVTGVKTLQRQPF